MKKQQRLRRLCSSSAVNDRIQGMANFKSNLLKFRKVFTFLPLEKLLLLFVKGTEFQGNTSKIIPPPDLYRSGTIRRATRDGINFELDNSCLMQWFVYWGLKDKTRDSLYSLVKPGDTILDVGTNIGETLLNFARLTGQGGFVYGFEPDERNHKNVLRNIELNRFENLHVFNLGVSDSKQTLKLFRVDPNNLGMNRILSETEAEQFDDFTTIEVDTIDNVIAENKIEKIDLIKIDIEGYEMHALRGARHLLETQRPKLFIEVGYTRMLKNGTSPNEMIAYLQSFGYEVRHSETDELIGKTHDFSPLGDGGIDVYAIAPSK